MTNFNFRKK